jgi:GntR family transcriptional repressor for pyruvate dehydrogenase complex
LVYPENGPLGAFDGNVAVPSEIALADLDILVGPVIRFHQVPSREFAMDTSPSGSALGLARLLAAEIARGRWKEGERLPSERRLAETYGVSRATVREGLRLLAGWGHVETRDRFGSFVQRRAPEPATPEETAAPVDILEARMAVEPVCARLAASRASLPQIAAIQAALARGDPGLDVDAFEAADEAFHTAVAEAARSALLAHMQSLITQARQRVGWGYVKQNEPPMRARYHAQHAAIAQAIAQHDARAAEEAAMEHLSTIAASLLGN